MHPNDYSLQIQSSITHDGYKTGMAFFFFFFFIRACHEKYYIYNNIIYFDVIFDANSLIFGL